MYRRRPDPGGDGVLDQQVEMEKEELLVPAGLLEGEQVQWVAGSR